jgi:uncharacterized membrane protein
MAITLIMEAVCTSEMAYFYENTWSTSQKAVIFILAATIT